MTTFHDLPSRPAAGDPFRALLESAPDAFVIVDHEGRIVLVNSQTEKLFGYAREEILGQSVEILVPFRFRDRHPGHREGYQAEPRFRPMGAGIDLYARRKDGTEFPVEISLSPLQTEEGLFVTSAIRDVSDRRRFEERLRESLHEKEVLLREIHHRVKNNLQVISSLLNLQSVHLHDEAALAAFRESQGRIRSMALVHEKLYQSGDLARVDVGGYIQDLAGQLLRSYAPVGQVDLEVAVPELSLGVDTAIPCSLILNELISNSLKHAFPGGRRGAIRVTLRETGAERFTLEVEDDGIGFPEGLDPNRAETLGLQLVTTLAEQLDGSVVRVPRAGAAGGTTLRVEFGELRYRERA
jgi:PAS domain S-box-containing protein